MNADEFAATYALAFPDSRPWSAREFQAFVHDSFTTVFGDPKGFLILRIIADEAEVITVATHPDFRLQGRASHYMGQALDHCKATGVTRVFLEVAADNHVARMLYDGLGFARCGVRKGYYLRENAESVDAILLEKQLSSDF